jgi:hypothetical protein
LMYGLSRSMPPRIERIRLRGQAKSHKEFVKSRYHERTEV